MGDGLSANMETSCWVPVPMWKFGPVPCAYNPSAVEVETPGLATHPQLANPDTLSQKLRWKIMLKDTQHRPLASIFVCLSLSQTHTLSDRHTLTHTHSHPHIDQNKKRWSSLVHMTWRNIKFTKMNSSVKAMHEMIPIATRTPISRVVEHRQENGWDTGPVGAAS